MYTSLLLIITLCCTCGEKKIFSTIATSQNITNKIADSYKIQEMCDKNILKLVGALDSVPDHSKYKKMCNKAVDSYAHLSESVFVCYKAQEICNKAVNTSLSAIKSPPECCKTREMCVKAVDTCPFVLNFVFYFYKTHETCDKAFWKIFSC